MKKKPRLKTAAIVTLYQPAKMTKKGRRQIAAWLVGRAKLLLKHSDLMAARFSSRYYYGA